MPSMKKLTAIAGTAAAARSYIRKHPDQVNKAAEKAGQFINKRTKGKYHHQIDNAVRKVATITGKPNPDPGPSGPPSGTTPSQDANT